VRNFGREPLDLILTLTYPAVLAIKLSELKS